MRWGNDIKPSVAGVDVAGSIFLINDKFRRTGVMFGFSCFFRSNKKFRTQIWRPPVNSTGDRFELIWEMSVTPSVVNSREDVSSFHFLKYNSELGIAQKVCYRFCEPEV